MYYYYNPYFTDEEIEVQKVKQVTWYYISGM